MEYADFDQHELFIRALVLALIVIIIWAEVR